MLCLMAKLRCRSPASPERYGPHRRLIKKGSRPISPVPGVFSMVSRLPRGSSGPELEFLPAAASDTNPASVFSRASLIILALLEPVSTIGVARRRYREHEAIEDWPNDPLIIPVGTDK